MAQSDNLIIVNSVYHLINAVNIKDKLLESRSCDILVTDITPALKGYIPNIIESGVFDNVIWANTKDISNRYMVKDIDEGYDNIDKVLSLCLREPLGQYSRIYFPNFDTFLRMLAVKSGQSTEFVWYEDGFSTYVIDYLRPDRAAVNRHPKGSLIKQLVKCALMYEPRLAMRGDDILNLPLCKISVNDTALKQKLNFIFGYNEARLYYRFVFLEQSFRAEGIKCNDIELIKECQSAAARYGFIVKPHPRNIQNLALELGLSRPFNQSWPFELTLLNLNQNLNIITVCSNAALTPNLMLGLDIPTIMLYKLFDGKVLWKEDDILKRFLDEFYKGYAGKNYFVPQTVYQLRNTIEYLGGRYE